MLARTRQRRRRARRVSGVAASASTCSMRSPGVVADGVRTRAALGTPSTTCRARASPWARSRRRGRRGRVAPGVQFRGAAPGKPGAGVDGAVAGMVHEQDGSGNGARDRAGRRAPPRPRRRRSSSMRLQAHEGIGHEQRGPQGRDRVAQAGLVLGQIQAEGRRGDDLDVERGERDAGAHHRAWALVVARVVRGRETRGDGAVACARPRRTARAATPGASLAPLTA